jgi:hypothetical protein
MIFLLFGLSSCLDLFLKETKKYALRRQIFLFDRPQKIKFSIVSVIVLGESFSSMLAKSAVGGRQPAARRLLSIRPQRRGAVRARWDLAPAERIRSFIGS